MYVCSVLCTLYAVKLMRDKGNPVFPFLLFLFISLVFLGKKERRRKLRIFFITQNVLNYVLTFSMWVYV